MAGMYYFNIATNEFVRKERHFGRNLVHETFFRCIKEFFNSSSAVGLRTRILISEILLKIRQIREFFENQSEFAFYSSSVLVAYDAAFLDESVALPRNSAWIRACMIDFAHVFPLPAGCLDQNYLFGLKNLELLLEAIRENEEFRAVV